jgi:hypothetical protein
MRVGGNKVTGSCRWLVLILVFASSVLAQNNPIEINYDFHQGDLGWTADFAEYSQSGAASYQLFAGIRYMPRKLTRTAQRGFYIQGNNNSAALAMYLKRRLGAAEGIVAGRSYQIQFVINFASNAPTGCVGVGSPPGEGVRLLAGASAIEPMSVLQNGGWTINLGRDIYLPKGPWIAGDIANGVDCEIAFPYLSFVLVQRQHQFSATANANGELWLLVGTSSGFEAMTRLYYKNIQVRLTPVQN